MTKISKAGRRRARSVTRNEEQIRMWSDWSLARGLRLPVNYWGRKAWQVQKFPVRSDPSDIKRGGRFVYLHINFSIKATPKYFQLRNTKYCQKRNMMGPIVWCNVSLISVIFAHNTPHRPPLGLNNFSILVRFLFPVRQLPSEVSPSSPGPHGLTQLDWAQLLSNFLTMSEGGGRSQIRKLSLYLSTKECLIAVLI